MCPGLAPLGRRLKKALEPADERISAFEEAKKLVGGAGDADAHAFADGASWMIDFAKPKFFVRAQINAVVAAVDLQRFRKAARAAREIQKFGGFAMALLTTLSMKWLP